MNRYFLFFLFVSALLSACGDSIPKVNDPHNIIVDGKAMTQTEFLNKYCAGKNKDETCIKVLKAKQQDSTRGKMPQKW